MRRICVRAVFSPHTYTLSHAWDRSAPWAGDDSKTFRPNFVISHPIHKYIGRPSCAQVCGIRSRSRGHTGFPIGCEMWPHALGRCVSVCQKCATPQHVMRCKAKGWLSRASTGSACERDADDFSAVLPCTLHTHTCGNETSCPPACASCMQPESGVFGCGVCGNAQTFRPSGLRGTHTYTLHTQSHQIKVIHIM